MRKEHRRVANKPRVERTERLEGSRFLAWQLYGLLAGGSRERLSAMFCPSPSILAVGIQTANRTAARRDVPASRLLLTDRAAMLRSGSPPGVGPLYTLGENGFEDDEETPFPSWRIPAPP
jgi:hypothetical protein